MRVKVLEDMEIDLNDEDLSFKLIGINGNDKLNVNGDIVCSEVYFNVFAFKYEPLDVIKRELLKIFNDWINSIYSMYELYSMSLETKSNLNRLVEQFAEYIYEVFNRS